MVGYFSPNHFFFKIFFSLYIHRVCKEAFSLIFFFFFCLSMQPRCSHVEEIVQAIRAMVISWRL